MGWYWWDHILLLDYYSLLLSQIVVYWVFYWVFYWEEQDEDDEEIQTTVAAAAASAAAAYHIFTSLFYHFSLPDFDDAGWAGFELGLIVSPVEQKKLLDPNANAVGTRK